MVMGLGFVGLTTALGFCEKGYKVYGYDPDKARINCLYSGEVPFAEPDEDEALKRHLGKRFFIAERIEDALPECTYVFFAVGTPCSENGQADLKYLSGAVNQVLNTKDSKFRVLTIKSTVPPTTVKDLLKPLVESRGFVVGNDIGIANNPEFLREGHCWDDFIHPDRIVIGADDEKSRHLLCELYKPFNAPVFCVSSNTGEFIKYLSNSLLATLISFSNEMSMVADAIGDIDIPQAFRILHSDHRWDGCNMTTYVYPGCGYGGYCLPKDTKALQALSAAKGFNAKILDSVISTNESMPSYVAKKVCRQFKPEQRIGILGLSFKPGSDDVRDSASAKLINELLAKGYNKLLAYDPISNEKFREYYGLPVTYCSSLEDIVEKADGLVIATAWRDWEGLPEKYPGKKIVDLRYML